MKSQFVQTSKGLIEYTLLGSGPVILICHGTSSNCYATELAGPLVETGFSVLTPSRPGYGRTPLDVGRSAVEAAQSLVALMDSLQVQTCAVLAISGGGPTGIALAANFPERVTSLVLAVAVSCPENRPNEPGYKDQAAFYGPSHNLNWAMLGLVSRLSPRSMARQTLAVFSTHDPDEGLGKLSPESIEKIVRFYRGHSSRQGALNDGTHTVGVEVLQKIKCPALIIHSREDKSVPFSHAEWSLRNISNAELYEAGITGHFFWVDPDFEKIQNRLVAFLNA